MSEYIHLQLMATACRLKTIFSYILGPGAFRDIITGYTVCSASWIYVKWRHRSSSVVVFCCLKTFCVTLWSFFCVFVDMCGCFVCHGNHFMSIVIIRIFYCHFTSLCCCFFHVSLKLCCFVVALCHFKTFCVPMWFCVTLLHICVLFVVIFA